MRGDGEPGLVDGERGLLRDDFEDGVGVGDVHKSVGAEQETQQDTIPATVDIADSTELVEIRLASG